MLSGDVSLHQANSKKYKACPIGQTRLLKSFNYLNRISPSTGAGVPVRLVLRLLHSCFLAFLTCLIIFREFTEKGELY